MLEPVMKNRRIVSISSFAVCLVIAVFSIAPQARAQSSSAPTDNAALLTIKGLVKQELHLSQADLKAMPRIHVTATDHDKASHEYEGVPLTALLAKAGVPQKGELRGKNMTLVLVAEANDGYHVAFSLAETDEDFSGTQVVVVDKADGKPLGAEQGPLRLVVPGDKRQGRWLRMLKSITVAKAGE